MIFLILKEFKLKNLKLVLLFIFSLAALATVIFFILYFIPNSLSADNSMLKPPQQKELLRSPLGDIPVILIWLLCIFIALVMVFIMIKLLKEKSKINKSFLMIKLEAEKAREALLKGKDFKNVIINCYKKMCIALEKEQEIQREKHMTVEEFENLLEAAGAPMESVKVLTKYFEAVRYGNWEPEYSDEQKAIRCFESIMIHFGNISPRKHS